MLALLIAVPAAWAQGQLKEQGKASVTFIAVGPAGLKIEGKTSQFTLREANGQVHAVVPLAMLDTGISLRNTHMREKYLETAKYPNAELTLPSSAVKRPSAGATAPLKAQGTLLLHGVTKPIAIEYTAHPQGNTYTVEGAAQLKLDDYGIKAPSYLGVTVKQDITIHVSFTAIES